MRTYLHVHTISLIPLWRTSPELVVLSMHRLYRKRKTCVLKLLYQEGSKEKWQAVEQNKQTFFQTTRFADDRREEPRPRTASASVAKRTIWQARFVLDWAVSKDPRGEWGAVEQSFLKPCIQKHIPKHSFKKLWSICRGPPNSEMWFILDLLVLIVLTFMQICTAEVLN